MTLTDPTPSLAIYRATLALPVAPSGPVSCPDDLGYRHTITFFDGQVVEATAVLNPEGCEDVTISGSSTTRGATDAYWTTLAENLGIQRSTLFSLASTTVDPDGGICQYPAGVNVNSSPSGPGLLCGPHGTAMFGRQLPAVLHFASVRNELLRRLRPRRCARLPSDRDSYTVECSLLLLPLRKVILPYGCQNRRLTALGHGSGCARIHSSRKSRNAVTLRGRFLLDGYTR